MKHREWYRASANGACEIYSQMYSCDNPKAIIQIAHGMSERSERYKDFMVFLCEHGYIVCANDHLGHGKSGHGEFGLFAKEAGGFDFAIEDIHALFEEVREEYKDLPVILLGHSMGSILSALFADRYNYLDKLILMGTPVYNIAVSLLVKGLTRSVRKHGYTHKSKLWNRMIWGKTPTTRAKQIKQYGWLTADSSVIEDFLDDPLCGAQFYDSGNLEMLSGLEKWGKGDWGRNIPDIPILFIAGTKDKIAAYGTATKSYYHMLEKTHSKRTLKLLKGDRHEVLNEKNKAETYQYLLTWLEESC